MKRVIYAGTSRINALRIIAKALTEDPNFKDCGISVNKDHNCADVIFPDGTMSQTYAKKVSHMNLLDMITSMLEKEKASMFVLLSL